MPTIGQSRLDQQRRRSQSFRQQGFSRVRRPIVEPRRDEPNKLGSVRRNVGATYGAPNVQLPDAPAPEPNVPVSRPLTGVEFQRLQQAQTQGIQMVVGPNGQPLGPNDPGYQQFVDPRTGQLRQGTQIYNRSGSQTQVGAQPFQGDFATTRFRDPSDFTPREQARSRDLFGRFSQFVIDQMVSREFNTLAEYDDFFQQAFSRINPIDADLIGKDVRDRLYEKQMPQAIRGEVEARKKFQGDAEYNKRLKEEFPELAKRVRMFGGEERDIPEDPAVVAQREQDAAKDEAKAEADKIKATREQNQALIDEHDLDAFTDNEGKIVPTSKFTAKEAKPKAEPTRVEVLKELQTYKEVLSESKDPELLAMAEEGIESLRPYLPEIKTDASKLAGAATAQAAAPTATTTKRPPREPGADAPPIEQQLMGILAVETDEEVRKVLLKRLEQLRQGS